MLIVLVDEGEIQFTHEGFHTLASELSVLYTTESLVIQVNAVGFSVIHQFINSYGK